MLRPHVWLGLTLIDAYQRWLSPRKGFRCAHRLAQGGMSCSEYGRHVLEQEGFRAFLQKMKTRFRDCAASAVRLKAESYTDYTDEDADDDERSAGKKRSHRLDPTDACFLIPIGGCGFSDAGAKAEPAAPEVPAGAEGVAAPDLPMLEASAVDPGGCAAGDCDGGGCDGCDCSFGLILCFLPW